MSTIGRYLISGLLVSALAGGSWLYVSHLRQKVSTLQTQVQDLERVKKIYEQDRKTDENTKSEQDRIDSLPAADLHAEFERLRKRSQGKNGTSEQADN
jgi:hypothetical protein